VRSGCSRSKWAESGNRRRHQTRPASEGKGPTDRCAPKRPRHGIEARAARRVCAEWIWAASTSLSSRCLVWFVLLTDRPAGPKQARLQIFEAMTVKVTSQNNDQFATRRQLAGMLAKELAKEALAIVALHSIADSATGNHPQPGSPVGFRYPTLKNKRSAVDTMTQAADSLKFAWSAQTHWSRDPHGLDKTPAADLCR